MRASMRLASIAGSDLHGPRIGIGPARAKLTTAALRGAARPEGPERGAEATPFPARAVAHAGAIVGTPEVARRVAEIPEGLPCRHLQELVGPVAVRRHWIHPELVGHHGHQERASLGRMHLVLRRASRPVDRSTRTIDAGSPRPPPRAGCAR